MLPERPNVRICRRTREFLYRKRLFSRNFDVIRHAAYQCCAHYFSKVTKLHLLVIFLTYTTFSVPTFFTLFVRLKSNAFVLKSLYKFFVAFI